MLDTDKIRLRSIFVIAVFIVIIGGLFVINLVSQPPDMLMSERRIPARRPELSAETIVSGSFMDGFESFSADSFPFRENFRAIRASAVFGVFLQTDKDGVYSDSNGIGSFQTISAASVEQAADKIKSVAGVLEGLNVFYAFIPDKSIYSEIAVPGFDPELVRQLMSAGLNADEFTFIPLVDALSAESFYSTDLHWDQTRIDGVLNALSAAMGIEIDLSQYSREFAGDFLGVYAGQFALPVDSEKLYYLSHPSLTAMYMRGAAGDFEAGPVYDLERFIGLDPYDIFLRGAQPLIILENDNAASDRELYLFRDSFSSSIAPLLAGAYSRVTVIDFRFIDLHTLSQLIDFTPGSDALFLYSSVILNNADALLVR